jgi:hypothetical protein
MATLGGRHGIGRIVLRVSPVSLLFCSIPTPGRLRDIEDQVARGGFRARLVFACSPRRLGMGLARFGCMIYYEHDFFS